jgi:hypothetical protein
LTPQKDFAFWKKDPQRWPSPPMVRMLNNLRASEKMPDAKKKTGQGTDFCLMS